MKGSLKNTKGFTSKDGSLKLGDGWVFLWQRG